MHSVTLGPSWLRSKLDPRNGWECGIPAGKSVIDVHYEALERWIKRSKSFERGRQSKRL